MPRDFAVRCTLLIIAGCTTLAGEYAVAHTIRPAVATVTVDAEGKLNLQLRVNVEALLAEIDPQYTDTNDSPNAANYDRLRALDPLELAARFVGFVPELQQQALLLVDGTPVRLNYRDIEVAAVEDFELARDSTISLSGRVPDGSTGLVWRWPAEYGSSVIRFRQQEGEVLSEWLQSGETSSTFLIGVTNSPVSRTAVVMNYLKIGFEHIVPKGLDHILFVVGIFLLSTAFKPLLLQVTAFTVAHTITLGLSIYGVISAPPSVVEPLIALSIAYVGIENCLTSKLQPWRIGLVFLFGLLHGMGFAGVLGEIGLPQSEFLTALITFNIGVEFGQLAVIAVCLLLVGWCRNRSWYRQIVVIPSSLLIAAMGLYWTWERTLA
jgi:hydrogenase/urease accessory protein HupE